MAVDVTEDELELFEQLFTMPSLEGMLAPHLEWRAFERFVAYVFTCAGYTVSHVGDRHFPLGPGVDLHLYIGPIKGKPVARVEVRHYAPKNLLGYTDVKDFVGVLTLMGGIPGYLVTTSGFTENAKTAAALPGSNCTLIDGQHLLRYITYVGGSRMQAQYPVTEAQPAATPISPTILKTGDAVAKKTARPPRQKRIVAMVNNKGGVAKTTTALNIGFALADKHQQRVLMVDTDGQASLTYSLPVKTDDQHAAATTDVVPSEASLVEYFRGRAPLASLVRETRFPNLWIIPAHPDLHRLDTGGGARAAAELQFIEDLRLLSVSQAGDVPLTFDWVILDTPPAQTFFTRIAVAAADYIVIPAFAEQYAVRGLRGVLNTVKTMTALLQEVAGWQRRMLPVLITRYKTNVVAEAAANALQTNVVVEGMKLSRHRIPLDDKIERAHHETIGGGWRNVFRLPGQPGPAARAYDDYVKEMLEYVNGN